MENIIPEYSDIRHLPDSEFVKCINSLRKAWSENIKKLETGCSYIGLSDSVFWKSADQPPKPTSDNSRLSSDVGNECSCGGQNCDTYCPRMEAICDRIHHCQAARSMIHNMWLDLDSEDEESKSSYSSADDLDGIASENVVKYFNERPSKIKDRAPIPLHYSIKNDISHEAIDILKAHLNAAHPSNFVNKKKANRDRWHKPRITVPKEFNFCSNKKTESSFHKYCANIDKSSKNGKVPSSSGKNAKSKFIPSAKSWSVQHEKKAIQKAACVKPVNIGWKSLNTPSRVKNVNTDQRGPENISGTFDSFKLQNNPPIISSHKRKSKNKKVPDFSRLHKQSAICFMNKKLSVQASMPLTQVKPFKLSQKNCGVHAGEKHLNPNTKEICHKLRATSAPSKFLGHYLRENETFKLRVKYLR